MEGNFEEVALIGIPSDGDRFEAEGLEAGLAVVVAEEIVAGPAIETQGRFALG